ncbi:MAG: hypothetical protein K6F50_00465 [Kiritimatiellae bacterium]|nr:hypothetical protein [Kiritimatiellia bacterium]
MKKLMIAMGMATSMALCASAAATYTTLNTGTGFEGLTVGNNLNTQLDDSGTSSGSLYWYSSAAVDGAVDSLIAQDAEDAQNATKYLSVDESEPLYRNAEVDAQGAVVAQNLTVSNVYFQADVQFTASDAESSSAGSLVTDGDKILVWLRGTEGGETNLIITAAEALGNTTQTDYVVTGIDAIDTTVWYTLCIEATTAEAGGTTVAAFTVKLCEKGGTLTALTATADEGATTTSTFYSLVDSGTAAATITCAGFKGTGAIDNLDFGTFAEEVVNYYEVNGTGYATFADALAAATTAGNATISLLQNVTLTPGTQAEGLQIDEGDVTLDLAGKVITSDGMTIAIYGGSLTITNSTETVGSVETTDADELACSIYNEATLVIKGGKYLGEVYTDETAGGTMAVYDADGNAASLQLDASGYYVITSGEVTTYGITITTPTNGTVSTSPATTAAEGATVTITAIPDTGYAVETITVTAADESPVEVTNGAFTMPAQEVTVAVTFAPSTVQVDVPTAVTDLVYDGTVKTGVVSNAGYTLSGTWEATDAGNYTATATLNTGYVWSDSSTDAKEIAWTIAKATATVELSLSVTSATYDSAKTTPGEYATPTVTAQGLTEGTDYSGAWDKTEVTSEGGTFTYTVSPVDDSNYTFTSVSATLTITTGGGSSYPSYIDTTDTALKAKYDAWAQAQGVTDGEDYKDAFLLNCATDAETVAAAKAAFKFTSITIDSTGKVTTATTTGYGDSTYNGTVTVKQYSDPACTTESETGTFFKAILSL